MQNLIQLVRLHTKLIGAAIALFVSLLCSAYGADSYCHSKSIHNDIDISAADKQTYIQITHSLAEKLRSIAESDALKNTLRENEVVLKELVFVCP